jgi:hypothetical protein
LGVSGCRQEESTARRSVHFLLATGGAEILHSVGLQPGWVHVQTEHPARVVLLRPANVDCGAGARP